MTMTTSGQILSWYNYLKTKENMNIKLLGLCQFDCLHFAQYMSMSPHGISCKHTRY